MSTALAGAARTVVKVGSSSLASADGGLDQANLDALVDCLAARVGAGQQVVLVSSGAIAAGLAPLGLTRRPRDLATLQAAASVGQGVLLAAYAAGFARHGLRVGQVLLTAEDVMRRAHYRNATRTFERLLSLGVVPVVNENDTVATEEIRFGDNDRLAALVVLLVGADALLLLSDVDALYDADPRLPGAHRIPEVAAGALPEARIGGSGSRGLGSGGMASKVAAARVVASAGVPALIAAAADAGRALGGDAVGTLFHPGPRRVRARLAWIAHASAPRGSLILDDGAVRAVVAEGRSLLPAGVLEVAGDFLAGDPVDLLDTAGRVVARGLVGYDAAECPPLLGRSTRELARSLGPESARELVHRDDLVVLSGTSLAEA